ncbi:S9 family peptidase [Paracoccus caeni]|uniref:prolyl oligopeptidase n=1 Tax=Paracoccus caeni TaxID=657651 RepID=A0A934SHP3_9RHOB|nr:prolyl oligopeptidase family serine peptidase [Paracoccus caeni]MBK4217659.1 S9 family peptidase [Paracoccus caeni]
MPELTYPRTERGDVVDDFFGTAIADPYRWLEADARQDSKVRAWINAQNAVTNDYLENLPGRELFRRRMADLLNTERHDIPRKRAGQYFFARHDGLQNQSTLYVRDGESGQDRLLIDPNGWSEDNADALAEWSVSDDGLFLAFAVQTGGTDWRTIKVMDVETGELLEDSIEWARFSRIAWAPDGSGFFYSRYPEPEGGATSGAGVRNQAVYFHRLGNPQNEDKLIYATPDRPEMLNIADRTSAGRYLYISTTPGTNESALTVVDLEAPEWTPRTIFPKMDSEWHLLGHVGQRLYLITTDGAERRRVMTLDLSQTHPQPVEILPEAEGVLNDAALLGGKLIVAYLVDAKTEMRRFSLDGTLEGDIRLPGIGTAGGLSGHPTDDEAFFAFTSHDAPTTVYRYNIAADSVTPWAQPKLKIDPSLIEVEQHFYASKDGTRVPMFVVRRRDVTGPAPTLLYGYGGFGISMLPAYNPLQIAWVEQGGVLAIANIRGGGEYGTAWHQGGRLQNKQNAFDDFIAAGEFLKAQGITSAKGLAIQGESGGGLLVGAVTNQRPDLFDVALPGVGVLDMLRYDQFTGGALWTAEFGSPSDKAAFDNLLTYSPYHTMRDGKNYPAILVTTADADDRVVPGHSFKYISALQYADLGPKPRLIRIETRAGHGAGMPLDKIIAHHADMWAFAAYWTGLELERD